MDQSRIRGPFPTIPIVVPGPRLSTIQSPVQSRRRQSHPSSRRESHRH
jgi:hypothetical protein